MASPTLAALTARVATGTTLLDRHWPGWAALIDLDRLDIQSPRDCVLGQLYGHYRQACAQLLDRVGACEFAHGFELHPDRDYTTRTGPEMFADLTEAWCIAILTRTNREAT